MRLTRDKAVFCLDTPYWCYTTFSFIYHILPYLLSYSTIPVVKYCTGVLHIKPTKYSTEVPPNLICIFYILWWTSAMSLQKYELDYHSISKYYKTTTFTPQNSHSLGDYSWPPIHFLYTHTGKSEQCRFPKLRDRNHWGSLTKKIHNLQATSERTKSTLVQKRKDEGKREPLSETPPTVLTTLQSNHCRKPTGIHIYIISLECKQNMKQHKLIYTKSLISCNCRALRRQEVFKVQAWCWARELISHTLKVHNQNGEGRVRS